MIRNSMSQDIAVIGMECYMPDAINTSEFWKHIQSGNCLCYSLPEERRKETKHFFDENKQPLRGAYLQSVSQFDYDFYHIPLIDAVRMDPAQRLLLDTVRQMLERAGYDGELFRGSRTGVYIGYSANHDYIRILKQAGYLDDPNVKIGNEPALISGRISYHYNLSGPSCIIDTACSSSLNAVHWACMGIRNGDCEIAIAGGVQLHLIPKREFKVGIESSDGFTRSFDELADGTGCGEGIGVVLLKPLDKAVNDGDQIHAVIKGTASNHDGFSAGISTPNPDAQSAVIQRAWQTAEIDPTTISYIEAHGTGTKIGDPIEVEGIRRAFAPYTNRHNFCCVSSVKSNIGHLDAAAGIAGLIKAVCCLKNAVLPPTVHFQKANPLLNIEESPIYLSSQLIPWEQSDGLRHAGVSSFSMNGCNCHIVLEEYIPQKTDIDKNCHIDNNESLFCLSAQDQDTLYSYLKLYLLFLQSTSETLQNICYSSAVGRTHYSYRVAIAASSLEELIQKIRDRLDHWDDTAPNASVSSRADFLSVEELSRADQIQQLAELYCQGTDINFLKYYERGRLVELPVYPVSRKECWPQMNGVHKKSEHITDEDTILHIFKEMVTPKIKLSDNFYEMGGDSINAIQIISRINEVFQINLVMSDLLENPVIGDFIEVVQRSIVNEEPVDGEKTSAEGTDGHCPLSAVQSGIFIQEALNDKSTYGMYSVIELKGQINCRRLEEALNQLIKKHEILRSVISVDHNRVEAILLNQVEIHLEYLENNVNDHIENFRLINREFDIYNGPMYWFLLVKKQNRYFLYTAIHHLLVDGYSISLLIDDLLKLYTNEAETDERSNKSTYRSYVEKEAYFLKNQTMNEDFWRSVFPEPPHYPFFAAKNCAQDQDTIHKLPAFYLPNETGIVIDTASKQEGTTHFVILLSAYILTLSKWKKSEDIVLGTVLNDRLHNEWRDVVGPMIKMLPFRIVVDPKETISAFMRRVNSMLNAVYKHKDYPLTNLTQRLYPTHNAGQNPLFDTVFVYQNQNKNHYKNHVIQADIQYYEKSSANFSLFVNIYKQENNRYSYTVNCNPNIIDQDDIRYFAYQFHAMLRIMCISRDSTVNKLLLGS